MRLNRAFITTMTLKFSIQLFILVSSLFLAACAQINPLQGGEKDTFAPRLDSAGTFPRNGQTNFTETEVILKFTEYVALNKPSENILITPQLKSNPTYRVKNKTLSISFAHELAENTTYTINFNRAITDITEKNDSIFQFVFSTGDFIDSLSLNGTVKDAFTNQPANGFLVALFDANSSSPHDSIPFLDTPFYITQTDIQGEFRFDYLKEGNYVIYAIKDVNRNLKLDPTENVAFLKQGEILVGPFNEKINLYTFAPKQDAIKLLKTKFDYPGKLTFILSAKPTDFSVQSAIELRQEFTSFEDSLVFWLIENPTPKMQFIVNLNGKIDTIKPIYKGIPQSNEVVELSFSSNLSNAKLLPLDSLKITFLEPISSINKNGVHCLSIDSLELGLPDVEILNLRTVQFGSLPPETRFVRIDSGCVYTSFGNLNQKTMWIPIEFLDQDYFGSLILNVDSVFQLPVIVQLLNDKNEVVNEQEYKNQLFFNELLPGKYQIRLVLDENGDGKWSTGSLLERMQPERIIYNKELIDIKSNWEKEIDWTFQN